MRTSGVLMPISSLPSPYGIGTMGKAARNKMEREFDRNIVTNIYVEEIQHILQ